MERAPRRRLGKTILDAVRATREAVGTNANLGTILLLAPLAAVPRERTMAEGVAAVLARLDAEDSRMAYEAIRLANPSGMGQVAEADLAGAAPADLVAAMQLAADRDLVAKQYTTGFHAILHEVVPAIKSGLDRGWGTSGAIVHAQLSIISRFPDSLIARKCGTETAQRAADHAAEVLRAGTPNDDEFWQAAADLDFWLRSDGHRRNPGTTADLIAAGLFALLRDGIMGVGSRQ
jgi:triphosphoribosyl-dephospho-CoA synthase